MVASRSNPAPLRLRGAASWISLVAITACSSSNDFFDQPMSTGGTAMTGSGGSHAGTGGSGAIGGSAGTTGGSVGASGGSANAAGNGGSAGSTGSGASAGTDPGTGGSDSQGGDGGESGDAGIAGTGGASGSGGEGTAGTQGDAGHSGSAGDSGAGGASGNAGMSGGAGLGGLAGTGGVGGMGGVAGDSGSGGKGGGKGGCGSQPEVCDGENNNCTGGADEGNACPSGCEGATEDGRIYVLCSGNAYAGSWQAAAARCEGAIATAAGVAMKLAVIDTEDENEFLSEWVQDRNVADGAWMGANDLDVDNEWSWGTGASRVPFYLDKGEGNNGDVIMNRFNDWGNGRPNGDTAMQDDEDCGHFDPVYNWRWNDRRCGDNLPAFVCEQAP